jgi:ABC-2 type transport system permease protein
MTATTYAPTTSPAPAAREVPAVRRATFADTLAAEWTKLRSLRSTWYTIGGGAAASIAMATLICLGTASRWDRMTPKEIAQFDPTSQTLVGVLFAAVIIGALAVRAITSEYGNGMIRVTFSAMPGRSGVMAAKAVILAAIALPVALIANVVGFLIGSQILATKMDVPSLTDPDTLRAIALGAVAVSLVALIGLGLGGIIRRTAGATTALSVGIIGSGLFGLVLPEAARQYLPGSAIQAMVGVQQQPGLLTPLAGLAVMVAYSVVAFKVATVLIARRDA